MHFGDAHNHGSTNELYDHETDPHEMHDLWEDEASREVRLELLELLLDQVNLYSRKADMDNDRGSDERDALTPTRLIHKKCRKWSEFEGSLD